AANIVSLVLPRAHGGEPVCLELCLERALPPARIAPPLNLAPDYGASNLQRVVGAIGAAPDQGRLNIRQAPRLLDPPAAPGLAAPSVAQVREYAEIKPAPARALAAIGLDHCRTVAPCGPGGILENHQIKREQTPAPSSPDKAAIPPDACPAAATRSRPRS